MSPDTEARLLEDVGAIKANVAALLASSKDHGARLGKMERRVYTISVGVAIAGSFVMAKAKAVLGLA